MRLPLAASAALLAVACSAVSTEDADSTQGAATVQPLTVVKGREWASCWFDVSGDAATLSCRSTERGKDPLGATVKITAAGTGLVGPGSFQSASKTLDIEAGGAVVVGQFTRAAFPVVLMMQSTLSRDAVQTVGETSRLSYIGLTSRIEKPEDLPQAQAASLKQPFDLWPVAFIDATEGRQGFSIKATEYTRSIAPYQGFLDTERALELAPSFASREATGNIRWFVAPESGTIDLTIARAGQTGTFPLRHPGYYAVTSSGFRTATDEEIAADFPESVTPDAPSAPTEPQEPEPQEPAAPAPPADPDPTCGGPNQSRCTSTGCDPGARLHLSTNKCVACGNDGETYCYLDPQGINSSSGNRCNPGTRFTTNGNLCVACGNDGQTYCYVDPNGFSSSSGNRCNPGTRFTMNGNKCVACGNDGQPHCYIDPNGVDSSSGHRCNPGTRFTTNGNVCIACGGEGQTYCYLDPNGVNSSNGYRCNDGLRIVSNTCVR